MNGATANAAPESFSKRRGSIARSGLAALFGAGLVVGLFILPVRDYLTALLEWVHKLGVWGPIVLAGFYVVAAVFFLPGSVLTLGAGFLFGVREGLLTVVIGANLGACAAFLVGRTVARDWVSKKIRGSANFAAFDDALGREGFKVVMLLRLSPLIPYDLLNYALGLTKVSFRDYATATLIGMAPGTLMYVYFGSAARSLADVAAGGVEGGSAGRVFFWIGLAATIAVAWLVARIARNALESVKSSDIVAPRPSDALPTLIEVLPDDAHNRALVSNVCPTDWVNPDPGERYNLVVVGAGTAGLVAAAGAAGLGARVALVERRLMGGDCLNFGCVPSKALIRSSRVYALLRKADSYGVNVPHGARVDFSAVMDRLRRLRSEIGAHDSAQRFKDLGVDVFLGHAMFTGPRSIAVGGQTLHFKKAIVATGAGPARPRLKGLDEAGFLTNETVFSLTERPSRLAVIGGGPIGCEMAQAFQRLGTQVILFHKNAHILDREDPDAAAFIQKRFIDEGIRLVLHVDLKEAKMVRGEKVIHFEARGKPDSVAVDEILVGAGRTPNVEHLGLEAARVKYDARKEVLTDDYLRTSNHDVYAAGDVAVGYKFTHTADAAARIVLQNALFRGAKKLSALTIPWCTYTDPEIAHVGMYEVDAIKRGIELDTFVRPLGEVDRARLDGEDEGFVKIHVKKGTDKIIGATVVAAYAGEMISELTLAMVGKIGLGTLSGVIHPYPTQAEAIKQAADAYNRTRLTPFVKTIFEKWFSWNRR